MEKRQILLFGILVLFFGVGLITKLSSQCTIMSCGEFGGFTTIPGGLQIVDDGEGERPASGAPGGIYFTYENCEAYLHLKFQVANLVPCAFSGYKFPTINFKTAPPMRLEVHINESVTIIDIQDCEYQECNDASGFNGFYWTGGVSYNLSDLCEDNSPSLDVSINFKDQNGNPYPLLNHMGANDIFDCEEFCFTNAICNGEPYEGIDVSFLVSDLTDACYTCEAQSHVELEPTTTNFPVSQSFQPNPFTSKFVFLIEGNSASTFTVTIMDAQGRIIHNFQDDLAPNGKYRKELNTNSWTPGVYYSKLQIDGKTTINRMIKMN